MPLTDQQKYCRYILLDNGIHQFTLVHPGREAIDQWLQQMTALAEDTNSSGQHTVGLLIDYSAISYTNSVSYILEEVRRWHQNTPRHAHALVAVLVGNSAMIGVVNMLLRTLRIQGSTVRLFRSSERDTAQHFLLAQLQKVSSL